MNYYNVLSIITLLIYYVICIDKIHTGLKISLESYKNSYAYSFYNYNHISFNTFNKIFINSTGYYITDTNNENINQQIQRPSNITNFMLNNVNDNTTTIHTDIYNIKKFINTPY